MLENPSALGPNTTGDLLIIPDFSRAIWSLVGQIHMIQADGSNDWNLRIQNISGIIFTIKTNLQRNILTFLILKIQKPYSS